MGTSEKGKGQRAEGRDGSRERNISLYFHYPSYHFPALYQLYQPYQPYQPPT
jgi:hypothetical protein